ncbi:MAG: DUF5996 family protein [Acidobacteriota bacterium]
MSDARNESEREAAWPLLPLEAWKDTYATLHMWTQVAGKIRLQLTPLVNHWWNVPLYVSSRGLTTSPIPLGQRTFEIQFDFIDHRLVITTSDGRVDHLPLRPMPVAEFYWDLMAHLRSLDIDVRINTKPCEVPDPIPFERDTIHAAYDPEYAHRFWRILVTVNSIFLEFRSRFLGKCSPVHFFWGSFDLAVSRFSGRRAPERPGADRITREAYSHEVISAGFWPGGGGVNGPAFYAYTVPQPEGYAAARARPSSAFYDPGLREFLLMYDDVRGADSPRGALLDFLQSTYEAGANLARWDRNDLEMPAAA